MHVIILAAGYSTRLRPLTEHTAKPLLPIGSKTILDSILEKVLRMDSLDTILIVVNAKFYSQFEDWHKQLPFELVGRERIKFLNDKTISNETRLGAVGDICLALEDLGYDEDVLIIAGDNMFEGDLQVLVELRNQHDTSVLGVHKFPDLEDVRKKFGVVTVNREGRVLEFEEKPETPKSSLAATAIYLLRQQDLKHVTALNESTHSGELNAGILIRELLRNGERVYCVDMQSWYDIGTQEDLTKAREHFQSYSMN
jgi:glucose-1-phosphate thymidylyltransferase